MCLKYEILEWWNTGRLFLKGYKPFLILSSTQILRLTYHYIILEPIIPIFHHSSIPIGAKPLTWGEAIDR
jgi:hypothetical protein